MTRKSSHPAHEVVGGHLTTSEAAALALDGAAATVRRRRRRSSCSRSAAPAAPTANRPGAPLPVTVGDPRFWRFPLARDQRSFAAQPTTPTICSTSTRAKGWSWYCG